MNTPEDKLFLFGGGTLITDTLVCDVYDKWGWVDLDTFFEKYGITDFHDQRGFLLASYWRHLHGKPIEFEERARKHKAQCDSEKPVVLESRQIPRSLLDLTAEDPQFGPFSIGSIKSRLKIVSLIDTNSEFSASYIRSLKDLRTRYPSKDLSFIVFVIPPELLTNEHWPALVMHSVHPDEKLVKEIAAFQLNTHDGILVAPASEGLVKALFQLGADL